MKTDIPTEIKDLRGIFADLKAASQKSRINTILYNIYEADRYPGLIESFAQILNEQGFRKLQFFSIGHNSVIFKSTENQLVRLSLQFDDFRDHFSPVILQPIAVFHGEERVFFNRDTEKPERAKPRVDVMPGIKAGKELITFDHEKLVAFGLFSEGLMCDDVYGYDNVGIIDFEGAEIPLLLDRDRVKRVGRKIFEPTTWLAADGKWKQKLSDPRILTNIPSGVFPEKELAAFEKTHNGSMITAAIRQGRLYGDELVNLLAETDAAMDRAIPVEKYKEAENRAGFSFRETLLEKAARLRGKPDR